ncbi:hypothetical protein HZB01_04865 [Candidatus Woesearchaeota archaeon]|nr:hypothetical protein [Candidatus Woesearchaeota archaeon]
MYNLKKMNGTFKGIIAECLFKLTRQYVVLPFLFSNQKYLSSFRCYFTDEQRAFIIKYWRSIDAIEIKFEKGRHKTVALYEVKLINEYQMRMGLKPKMTLSVHSIFLQARNIGFTTKLIYISLKDDWNYLVEEFDFDSSLYSIDKPKPYDREKNSPGNKYGNKG